MREFAQAIRERVPMREMAERVGLNVNRHGYASCPFHGERTPSMKIYEGTGGWHCFGCGAHGSVIDFAMQYFGITFPQAIVRLDTDFSLGLPINRTLSLAERRKAAEEALRRRKESQAEQRAKEDAECAYWGAFDILKIIDRLAMDFRPVGPEDEFHALYALALHMLPQARENLAHAEYEREMTCRKKDKIQPPTPKAS